ncbi:MAG: long-chain acyl-CoA synthetase [Thermodesulfobacteriota bacterium]|nr:long-chain acyl-CoA synthetase [Thermodesulfobacteriota bacterium]
MRRTDPRGKFASQSLMDRNFMQTVQTTLPKLLLKNAATYGNRVAMRTKHKGIWKEISWQDYAARTQELCCGLVALGMKKGDHASILGENCPEWVFADLAIQSLGGVSVGIYPTNSVEQVRYILDHSQSRFVVVKDQEQADKVLAAREHLPNLTAMLVIDMKGVSRYEDSLIVSYQEVEKLGKEVAQREPAKFQDLVNETQPDDVAFIVYTSGTTGPPKGAMISHRNIIHQVVHTLQPILHFTDQDSLLSYLPLCHIFERNLSMAMPLVFGYVVNFAESIDTVQENIREISPSFFAAVPRILEKLHSSVHIKLQDSSASKKLAFRIGEIIGKKAHVYKMKREPMPFWLLPLYGFAYLVSLRPLREKLGLLDCRCLMSGGAPIAPEVLAFFRHLGITTVEMYGLTETSGGCAGPLHQIKHGSVGQPSKGLEFKLADDGEMLFKGESIFSGYYRDESATAEILHEGWLYTGDVGTLDEDGHLYIIDRKKDIIITSGGKNISPSEIENKLKCSPYIKEAIIIGDGKKYITALIQIDYDNAGNWAQNSRIPYTTYKSLATNPELKKLIHAEISSVNDELAQVEKIKKFMVLEKELDQDDEELTATQKVKRKVITKRFHNEIESMYR